MCRTARKVAEGPPQRSRVILTDEKFALLARLP